VEAENREIADGAAVEVALRIFKEKSQGSMRVVFDGLNALDPWFRPLPGYIVESPDERFPSSREPGKSAPLRSSGTHPMSL